MKAILVDPITKTIQGLEVVNSPKAGTVLAEHMRDENGAALPDGYALQPIDKYNHMMVDETGMLEHREPKHFFTFDGELYTGRAVITGYYRGEAAGGSGDTTLTIEEVTARVKFAEAQALAQWGGLEKARYMEVISDPDEIRRLLFSQND